MKQILLSFALGALVLASTPACPLYQVPNPSGLCIRPFYIQGCQTYLNTDRCSTCKEGYQINSLYRCDSTGKSTNKPVVGCLVENAGKCSNCATGFKLSNVEDCTPGVTFCVAYRTDGSCAGCESGFSLVFNLCKRSSMLGCIATSQSNENLCATCAAPFSLNTNGHCQIQNCKTFNDFGCTHCQCGYGINQDGTCSQLAPHCAKNYQEKCAYCIKGYQLNSSNNCVMVGCADYQKSVCNQCMSGFQAVADQKGRISCKRNNCLVWDDAICKSCESGFSLVSGFCVQITAPYTCTA